MVGAVILILTHIFAYKLGRMSALHDVRDIEVGKLELKDIPNDIKYFALKYLSKDRDS